MQLVHSCSFWAIISHYATAVLTLTDLTEEAGPNQVVWMAQCDIVKR